MSESLTCRVRAGLCAIAILGSASRIAEAQSQFPPLNSPGGTVQPAPTQNRPAVQVQPPAPGPANPYGGLPAQPPPANPGGTGGFTGVQPNPSGGASANPQLDARLDQMMQAERQDLGVPPTPQIYNGPMHGPAPNQIPGGQVVTTKGLVALMQGAGAPYVVFDVLGAGETLPGAVGAVAAAAPGSFADQTQQQFGQFLAQVTRRNPDLPLVFYCQGINCWMSYNASLRAIHLGYHNVLWYRGGLEAWKYAGLPTQPPQQNMPR